MDADEFPTAEQKKLALAKILTSATFAGKTARLGPTLVRLVAMEIAGLPDEEFKDEVLEREFFPRPPRKRKRSKRKRARKRKGAATPDRRTSRMRATMFHLRRALEDYEREIGGFPEVRIHFPKGYKPQYEVGLIDAPERIWARTHSNNWVAVVQYSVGYFKYGCFQYRTGKTLPRLNRLAYADTLEQAKRFADLFVTRNTRPWTHKERAASKRHLCSPACDAWGTIKGLKSHLVQKTVGR